MDHFRVLREAGLKVTPQRRFVYETLMEMGHATVDELILRIKEEHPCFTLSTVYRILETFVQSGVVSILSHPLTGKTYYEITAEDHHHRFTQEGIIDYEDPELTEIVKKHLRQRAIPLIENAKVLIHVIEGT